MRRPADLHTPSPKPYGGLPDLGYPPHDRAYLVTACGRVCMHRKKINTSTVLARQNVGLKEVDEDICSPAWLSVKSDTATGTSAKRLGGKNGGKNSGLLYNTCQTNQLVEISGGESGIRTHGTLSRTHAFQACALSRSAISPSRAALTRRAVGRQIPGRQNRAKTAQGDQNTVNKSRPVPPARSPVTPPRQLRRSVRPPGTEAAQPALPPDQEFS